MTDTSLTTELLERLLIEAVRLGAIPVEAIEKTERHLESQAACYDGSDTGERYATLLAMAQELRLRTEFENDGASELWVRHHRKQMRLKTAWLEAKREKGEADE